MLAFKRPEPRPGVLEIEPYLLGSNATLPGATVFKLSSNETPLGPSPEAVAAYHEAAEHLAVYPDGSSAALRAAIGRAYSLNPSLIVCGAGSDELLKLLAHTFLGPGDEAIHTVHGFLVFRTATLSACGRPVAVPESNYTANIDMILRRSHRRPRWYFWQIPIIPPGLICLSMKLSACAGIWPKRCCWSSTPPTPNGEADLVSALNRRCCCDFGRSAAAARLRPVGRALRLRSARAHRRRKGRGPRQATSVRRLFPGNSDAKRRKST